jgi:hypothetical protein
MKDKKIVCPRGTEPAVIKRAAEAYKKYLERVKDLQSKRSRGRVVDFKDMAPSDQKRMREAVLASQCNASQASSMTGSSGSFLPGPVVFIVQVPDDAFVLNATAPARRILPVPIQPSFPHITLQLGQVLGCSKCLSIRCVVDTAAALNTGNLHYYAAIARAYPHTIAAIFSAADHNPIARRHHSEVFCWSLNWNESQTDSGTPRFGNQFGKSPYRFGDPRSDMGSPF